MAVLECVAYLFYPSLLGFLYTQAATFFPSVFSVLYFFAPVLLFAGWFWAGSRYAVRIKNPALAILAGNSLGLLSLAIYLWQEFLAPERVNWLQQLAQYFSAALLPLTVGLVAQFSPEVDGVTQVSNTALQCAGLVLVALAFTGGYFYRRNKDKLAKTEPRRP